MKNRFYGILLVIGLLFSASCSDSDGSSQDMGTLRVQLTDAPFPFDLVAEANVTIFKVDARLKRDDMNAETEEGMEDNEGENSGSPFVVLMEEELQVNLLELTNGSTQNLADIEIPQGTYDLVRVFVRGINVVLKDDTTYDLKVPSGAQSGIKVFIKPGIVVAGGLTADLLLDFDVSRSFIPKGNIKSANGITGFNFKPVIKASNMSVAGTLGGTVTTLEEEMAVALEGVQISIFAADTLNTTTFTDVDGNYSVMGLLAGSYDVSAELEGYTMQSEEGVEITAGNKTVQDFELLLVE